ncbi:S1C family serine protease [Sciscionella marina]|uniref:S1C family serine protease n=1 Tax=Sciscionella marina TaxID=508770 RepID=UPI0003731F31|nr:trypsin-like peptidase domain-containing protein [Sciscionella marina]
MSEQANGRGAPRIGPRPLHRPQVDPESAAVFGRPDGVPSAFAPRDALPTRPQPVGRPPESLTEAFGGHGGETGLQRPPSGGEPDKGQPDPFWDPDAETDPWRDPGTGAVLGAPAVSEQESDAANKPKDTKLSLTGLLFGRSVARGALVVLAVAALLIGAVGGVTGWLIGRSGTALTDGSATLAQVDSNVERPKGSVADVVKRAAPAVVSLEVVVGNGGQFGSGVVISPDGYILTNNHVVAQAASNKSATITAVFNDGTRSKAQIVGRDAKTDLAVVKVNVTNPTAIQLGRSSGVQVGDSVIAIGSPLEYKSSVTTGIVSGLNRPVVAAGENGDPPVTYDAIQTDAAINHGNSGGPLLNSSGALIGINSAIKSSGPQGGSIGIGFAIPVDQARQIAQGLIRNGSVKHASLGANVRSVSATSSQGAQLANVAPGGAAAKAGLKEGDVITRFAGNRVDNAEQLQVDVLTSPIGKPIPMQIVRGGASQTITVTLQSD